MNDLYKPEQEEENVILAIKLPIALRAAWANHCTKRGSNMSLVLRRFIEAELKAAEATPATREPESALAASLLASFNKE